MIPCSHLGHNGNQDEGTLWRGSYHQSLKNKTKAFSQLQWHEQSLVPLATPGCG